MLPVYQRDFYIKPYINDEKVDFMIEAVPTFGERELFSSFLEKSINNDNLFARGNFLYDEKTEKFLPRWRKILKRAPENGALGKMSCRIINNDISTHKLRIAIFDYMVRPILYFCLIHSKEKSSN